MLFFSLKRSRLFVFSRILCKFYVVAMVWFFWCGNSFSIIILRFTHFFWVSIIVHSFLLLSSVLLPRYITDHLTISLFDGCSKNRKLLGMMYRYIHYLNCGDYSMGVHIADVLFKLLYVDYSSKKLIKKLNCHDEWLSRMYLQF